LRQARKPKNSAVAANEVLRHLRIPQRIGLVLRGESLLNDATALLIYRAAVAAAVGSFSLVGDAPILLLAAVGSLVAGADALLVDFGLHEPCQVSQRLLPTEITGLRRNHVRQAFCTMLSSVPTDTFFNVTVT
jgi:hypothetical protein